MSTPVGAGDLTRCLRHRAAQRGGSWYGGPWSRYPGNRKTSQIGDVHVAVMSRVPPDIGGHRYTEGHSTSLVGLRHSLARNSALALESGSPRTGPRARRRACPREPDPPVLREYRDTAPQNGARTGPHGRQAGPAGPEPWSGYTGGFGEGGGASLSQNGSCSSKVAVTATAGVSCAPGPASDDRLIFSSRDCSESRLVNTELLRIAV